MYQAYRMPNKSFLLSGLWRFLSRPPSGNYNVLQTTALTFLLTASLSLVPAGWDDQGCLRLVGAWAAESQLENSDDGAMELDDEVSVEDDGSARLGTRPPPQNPPQLQPLSSDEEKALLGNWGDADDEDGD